MMRDPPVEDAPADSAESGKKKKTKKKKERKPWEYDPEKAAQKAALRTKDDSSSASTDSDNAEDEFNDWSDPWRWMIRWVVEVLPMTTFFVPNLIFHPDDNNTSDTALGCWTGFLCAFLALLVDVGRHYYRGFVKIPFKFFPISMMIAWMIMALIASFASESALSNIQRWRLVYADLTGVVVSIISMVFCFPWPLQYARESVDEDEWEDEGLKMASMVLAAYWTFIFCLQLAFSITAAEATSLTGFGRYAVRGLCPMVISIGGVYCQDILLKWLEKQGELMEAENNAQQNESTALTSDFPKATVAGGGSYGTNLGDGNTPRDTQNPLRP